VEGEDGPVEWPGRNIAEALKAALERLGYGVSEPMSAEHAGWELDISRQRKRLWIQFNVISADLCYLIASRSNCPWPDMKIFLTELQEILENDTRFDVVGWLPEGDPDWPTAPWRTPFEP
jgi:hypothetical protein